MRRAKALPISVIALSLLGLGACRPEPERKAEPPANTQTAQRGGQAVFAYLSDINGVNELIASGTLFSSDVLQKLFLPLLREQSDYRDHPPTFAPALATSHEFSEDRKRLTFKLRSDVLWSDGVPVTAEDVRWTWQAQMDPEVSWDYAQVKENITDVEVLDPHTVRFHFSKSYAYQLLEANEGLILPKHAWSELPFEEWRSRSDWFSDHLVTNGPFLLESWKPQEQIVLARNDRYFDSTKPYLDRIVFRFLPDLRAQVTELVAGRLDFVNGLSVEDAALIEETAHTDLVSFWNRAYTYLCWNTARPLFAEKEVRRALTMAIDRELLIESIWGRHARPSTSPIISSVWAHDRSLEPWPFDPDEARRLLAEHGWQDHDGDGLLDKDGRSFSFEMTSNAGNTIRSDTLVLIQQQLARIGIDAQPRLLEMNTLIQSNMAHDFDATVGTWGIDTTLDISYAFHTLSIDDGWNYGSYSNPEVDRLIDEAGRQTLPEEAGPFLIELQRILHEEQPYTFLWEPEKLIGTSRRLRNVQSNALLPLFDLEEWWLAE